MKSQQKLKIELTQSAPSTIHISSKCNYREEGDLRVIFANGIPLLHYAQDDKAAHQYAMVHLVETGLASQQEVAEAFGCSRLTIFRAQNKYNEGGMVALMPKKRGPKDGSKVNQAKTRRILALKEKGLTNVAIGCRLGLKEDTVRKALKRMGWSPPQMATQIELAMEPKPCRIDPVAASASEQMRSAITESPVLDTDAGRDEIVKDLSELEQVSYDADPSHRVLDRALARVGLLQDALPVFRSGSNIPCVGVLISIPALIESGVFTAARRIYGDLGASFYGLRTILVTLLLMALLRIKRAERLKEHAAADLGRLLGLDRVCEVKTLRRKLDCLAAKNHAVIFGQELAKTRLQRREGTLGFLYVDGHVRVYNGTRKLTKAYVTQKRLAMPATTDYWVNDQQGDPIFVVTAPANDGLVKMLPSILQEAKSLIGENRPVTVIFDRGGWSPKLFVQLIKQRIDIITYRKGKTEPIPVDHFYPMAAEIEGKKIEYRLHERSVAFFKGQLWLRQVSRLNPSGHQTHIITSRQDLSALTIAYRMFERWRQENYFKYMAEEYALDAMVDYDIEEEDLERLVPNPKRKEINRERNKIQAELEKLQRDYGLEALRNKEAQRPTMRGFKAAHSAIGQKIEALKQRELELKALYEQTPAKVPLKDTLDNQTVYRLRREKKHLTDLIKMVAYQAETDLLSLIRNEYARADDEGRTLIHSALKSSGDLQVKGNELRIILNPLSSPHRS
ncbi:MAG: helix-turn-helix domain-containing protein, partial [Desulfobacterales bacterium]